MLVVDSSVWIDFFRGVPRPGVELLQHMLDHGEVKLIVPDLVLFEVLRGFRQERDHRQARLLMESLAVESTGGAELARIAAQHYRALRSRGITIASAIDVLVATYCIENDYALLHADGDFDAFESLRGLRTWRH